MSDYRLKSILNRNFKPVQFRANGKPHYQMFLEIESDVDKNLDKITKVEYVLHPTFKNRYRSVANRDQHFQLELKAWGTFVVRVKLFMIDGTQTEFTQAMKDNLEKSYL
ncbi:MAG: hypothetical protein KAJ23_17320 [Maribacter sp.]|nr:hypothetical protein [Maribacter sp.]